MKILITAALFVTTSIGLNLTAQTKKETKEGSSPILFKRVDNNGNTSKAEPVSLPKSNKEKMADPNDRVSVKGTNTSQYSESVPATKTSATVKIKEISYSLDNSNSALDNLLLLIELKEKINQPENSELLDSPEYNTLLKDISALRQEFDSYVESKGIQNCSTAEQNHYLAFLKEEGKEKQYQEAIQKIK